MAATNLVSEQAKMGLVLVHDDNDGCCAYFEDTDMIVVNTQAPTQTKVAV